MAAGRKNKLKKIGEIAGFPNVYQCPSFDFPKLINSRNEEIETKGNWQKLIFKN